MAIEIQCPVCGLTRIVERRALELGRWQRCPRCHPAVSDIPQPIEKETVTHDTAA